jgi:uncharacterized SAM-binding protein YcdF (DUF218 family)
MNLSSILGALVEPLGLLWLLSLAATVHLIRRRNYRGALYPATLAILVWVVGGTSLAGWLLASLERPYAPVDLARLPACDAVVMLGGGVRPSRHDPLGFDCTAMADRFLLGLELVRLQKAPVLVLGGGYRRGGDYGSVEVRLTKDWLGAWGLTNAAVLELGRCANTRVEAERLQVLAQQHHWQRVLLVTSAWHMKRAEAAFRNAGITVVPAACDFRGLRALQSREYQVRFLAIEKLEDLGCYIHERLGWLVYRWRGWV